MKNTIKFIAIAILAGISFLNVSAQEQTIVSNTEGSATSAKADAKPTGQTSSNDSWTGFHVGGYVGNTNNRASANTSTIVTNGSGYFATSSVPVVNSAGAQKLSSNRVNVGGTFGYTKQMNRFAIGAEVDLGSQGFEKTSSGTATYPCCAPAAFTIKQTVKSNWLMTVRPRAGYANDKVFVYATGGLAVTKIDYTSNFTDTFLNAKENGSFSKTKAGWTAGAGVEVKVAKKLSVKGEYLFSQFGRESTTSNNLIDFANGTYPSQVFTHSSDLKSHGIRFGINYRF